jgi:autotransporter-associated beta strand protein
MPRRPPSVRSRLRATVAALALLAAGAPLALRAQIPAFPGAQGFGAYATGGRGGDVYTVTNLNGTGAGSLRFGVENAPATGRTIVFAVSGYIPIANNSDTGNKTIRLVKSKITIAGQTAPGDGIGLKDGRLLLTGNNQVVRHLRVRHGKYGSAGDCINLDSSAHTSIIDHVSLMFSTDENISFFNSTLDNFTLQHSVSAWGMERHNAGGLWDLQDGSCHHTLWAHHRTRNPKARPYGLLEWVNNVTFHWRNEGFIMGDSQSNVSWKANVRGNYFLSIPDHQVGVDNTALSKARVGDNGQANFSLYLDNCLHDSNNNGLLDGTDKGYSVVAGQPYPNAGTTPGTVSYNQSATPFAGSSGSAAVVIDPPRTAYKKVVSASGPLRLDASFTGPLRDELDTLLINSVLNQQSILVAKDSPLDANDTPSNGEALLAQSPYNITNGGFGTLNSTAAPTDTDGDGMPDYWEGALGWATATQDHNTALASSGGILTGPTLMPVNTPAGYTRLEEYLHFKASPHAVVSRNTAAGPSSLSVDLSRYTLGFNSLSPVFTLANVVGGSVAQSGAGGRLVTFTPTLNASGRARFEFTVTDSQGDTWTQSFLIMVANQSVPRSLVWQGDGSANAWDTTALNWKKGDDPVAFAVNDTALFDDRGSASPAISLPANVAAGAVTFDTTRNYTLSGAGALTVGGQLVKRGTGTLTLSNASANSFGSVVHEAGGLTLTNYTAGGSTKLQLNGGTLTLSPGGTANNITNPLEFNAPTVVNVTTQHNATGNWTGSGDVTVNTSALWTIAGTWSGYSGRITLGPAGTPRLRLNQTSNTNFGSANLAIDLGQGSGQFMNRNGGTTAYAIGTLTGGPNTQLQGTQTANGTNSNTSLYSIGARGEDATFQGMITNGGTGGVVATLVNKVGTGAWTLTGASTHTGLTTVSAGTLRLNGSFAAAPITVASGATLAGSGATGGVVTVSSGGKLNPGSSDGAAGTFTSSAGLNAASGSTLVFDLGPTPAATSDKITVSGGVFTLGTTVNAQINFLDLTAGLAPGTYSLVDGASTLAASSSTVVPILPAATGTTRQTFSISRAASGSPTFLNLVVAGSAAPLVWSGASGGLWDLNTTSGNFTGGSPSVFYNLDRVTFNDTGSGGSIVLSGTLQPSVVTVNNSTRAYSFDGAGVLGGAARLVKSGAGTFTLANTAANPFTGGVRIEAGTLALGNASTSLGTGLVTLAGGTLALPNATVFLNNSVVVSGASAITSAYVGSSTLVNSTASTFSSSGPATLDLSGVAGTLSINGAMSGFSGTINFGAGSGMLRLNSNTVGSSDVNFGSASTHLALGSGSATLTNRNGDITIELGAVSGGPSTRLSGRQSGSGETTTTYRVGGANLDTTFAGQIVQGGDLAGLRVVKIGTAGWTLSGTSTFGGSVSVEAGRLVLPGSLILTGKTEVGPNATLELANGTFAGQALDLAPGAVLTGGGTISGDLNNQGEVSLRGAVRLTITGDILNDGVMRLAEGAELVVSGAIVNNGVLDLMTAGGVLPTNLVNNGTVLDASAIKLSSWSRVGTAFTLTIASYAGHTYTLQTTEDVAGAWSDLETRDGATGQNLVFTHDAGPSPRRFYRIKVR